MRIHFLAISLLILIPATLLAEETPTEAQSPDTPPAESAEEAPAEDATTPEEALSDDLEEITEGDEQGPWYVDLNTSIGRRWYDKSDFSADVFQLTTEWSYKDVPVRFGPSMSYLNLNPADDFYSKGQMLEVGARVSAFYDLESFLPYLSLDYTLVSSGSIKGSSRIGSTESSGTLDISNTGIDVSLGCSFIFGDWSIVVESSLYSSKSVHFEGTIS